jgi:hypothetical protein
MLEMLPLWKRLALAFGVRRLLDFFESTRATDPQLIKRQYCTDILGPIEDELKNRNSTLAGEARGRTYSDAPDKERFQSQAAWYAYRAQMLWGRPSMRERFRSAWLYVTAARLNELGGNTRTAAQQYHYAANGLREVEAYRASIEHYIASAKLYASLSTADDRSWCLRCLYRAFGVAQAAGDLDSAGDIRETIHALPPAQKQFPELSKLRPPVPSAG